MARRYFGTDGIRGLANKHPMTAEIALKVGMAAGHLFTNGSRRHRVVIGKDTRLSGYMIESAMQSGFTSVGMDVFLLGPMPTPAVAMLTRSLRADLGVMISASHNRYEDNGIKLFDPDGYKLSDETELEIEALIDNPTSRMLVAPDRIGRATRVESAQERYIEFAKRTLPKDLRLDGLRIVIDCANGAGYKVAPDRIGRATRVESAQERYIEFAKRTLPKDLRLDGLRIVIDCANGAGYKVAPEALWELGAEVIKIGVEPNGRNINDKCGSTAPGLLCEKVRELRADIGIALDGDADRVVIVNEKGQIVDGDQLMAVIAESWHSRGKLAAGGIVATVMSNLGLERYLGGLGLTMVRTGVGDRYVVEHMRRHGYNVGGEQSGHIVLSDYITTGDGLVAALQILAVVVTTGKPVSEVTSRFKPLPQLLQNVRYASGKPLEDSRVLKAIDAGKAKLGTTGRLVIRPSGTEPVIRVMAEGDDELLVSTVVGDIVEAVRLAAA